MIRFTDDDMALFAAASGDRSLLHTEPAFARRTAFGECIVYGGLETIAMLGALPREALASVRSVRSSFPGPVLIGEPLSVHVRAHPSRPEWEIRLNGRGKLLARVVASAEAEDRETEGEQIAGDYSPGPELDQLARRFGLDALDRAVLEGVCWASNVVGMTIPDFDGLCAAVNIVVARNHKTSAPAHQRVVVRDRDARTDRMVIDGVLEDASGAPRCFGVIECFPFSPTPLPESAALSGPVEPITGSAVVVGASRGLGAALTLALLAHGYSVHGVYARSVDAAADVVRLAGPYAERLQMHQLDAGEEDALAHEIAGAIDVLCLCAAPPPLPMGLTGALAEFVASSARLVAAPLAALAPRLTRERGCVVVCSCPAAVEAPRELPQLAAAKAAVEGLARWVSASHRVLLVRPPKLRTDLVNSPAARAAATPPEVVASEIVARLADEAPGLTTLEPGRQGVGIA